jgi:stage V sporulation protein B
MADPQQTQTTGGSKDLVRVGRGAAAFLAGSVVAVVTGLVRVILLVHTLGVDGYGALVLAVTVTALIGSVTNLGLQLGVTRMMAHAQAQGDDARAQRLLRASILVGTATGIVGTIIALAIGWSGIVDGHSTMIALEILAPIVLMTTLRPALFGALRAYQDLRAIFILGIVTPIIDLVTIGIVILAGLGGIGWFAIALVVSAAADLAMTSWFVYRHRGGGRLTDTTWADARALIAFSLPLLVTQLTFYAIQRSDVLLLGIFQGARDVGLYAPVMRVVEASQKALGAFPLLYVPIVAALVGRKNSEGIRRLYLSVTKWGYVAGFTLLLPLVVAPAAILHLLFGSAYVSMATVARVLAIGYWTTIITGLNGVTLGALGLQRKAAGYSAAGGIANLVLGFLLIPAFGPAGAAWSNTLSYILINVLFSVLLFRKARITPFRSDTTKLFVFSGIVTAAGLGLSTLPAFNGTAAAIGLAVAAVIVWLSGALLWKPFQMEWAEIRKIVQMRGSAQGRADAAAEADSPVEETFGPSPDTESGI